MDLENKLSFYLWVKAMNCVTNLIKLGTKLAQTLQGNAVKFTSCSTNFEWISTNLSWWKWPTPLMNGD